MNKITLGLGIAMTMVGCSTQPKLAPLISMPSIPKDEVELVQAQVPFVVKNDLHENVVQQTSHIVEPNSSVVINVPISNFEQQDKDTSQDFKTDDFFNVAEQQIEKMLIKNGFKVLSRSKFEAKLRKLRDETKCDENTFRCIYSQVDADYRPILDDLKDKFEKGNIDAVQYASELNEFKVKFQTASRGRTRREGEHELTDISEVIRAAESGDVKADYILQINMFDTNQKFTISEDLRHIQEIRAFVRDNPSIQNTFENGNHILSCSTVGAKLNAKLVHVKTGAIVWIGEHQLNEYNSGVEVVSIEMGSKKYVSNILNIKSFVDNQNTFYQRQARYGRDVSLPEFQYSTSLIKPTVIAGKCEKEWIANNESRTLLARQVAKDLIGTIKVSY